jgi:site-specific DNA recombinase
MFQTYSLKGKNKYRYYVCSGAQKNGYKSCPTRSVNAQAIEDAVIDGLKKIATDSPEQQKKAESLRKQTEKEIDDLTIEQQKIDDTVVKLSDKIKAIKDTMPTKTSEKDIKNLQESLKENEQLLSEIHVKKAKLHEQIITKEEIQKAMVINSPAWDTLFPQEKKRVIDFLVKEVDYDGASSTLGITLNANGIKLLCTEING